jgi:hypothetical protein
VLCRWLSTLPAIVAWLVVPPFGLSSSWRQTLRSNASPLNSALLQSADLAPAPANGCTPTTSTTQSSATRPRSSLTPSVNRARFGGGTVRTVDADGSIRAWIPEKAVVEPMKPGVAVAEVGLPASRK